MLFGLNFFIKRCFIMWNLGINCFKLNWMYKEDEKKCRYIYFERIELRYKWYFNICIFEMNVFVCNIEVDILGYEED